jgi:hypothetical protein
MDQVVYIVTRYGCNSTPSDLWTPITKLFSNYEEAYAYFLKVSPSLDNEDCKARQFRNNKYEEEDINKCGNIEVRVQIAGYHSGHEDICAKRPEGVVIAREIIKN